MWLVRLLQLFALEKQLDSSSPHESICHSSVHLRQDTAVVATLTIKPAWSFLMEASECTICSSSPKIVVVFLKGQRWPIHPETENQYASNLMWPRF